MRGLSIFLLLIILVSFPSFGYAQEVQISVSAEVPEVTPEETPPGGGGSPPAPPAKVVLKGRAYPSASLTLLRNGVVAATFQAFSSGLFEKTLTGLRGGVYTFGIWAEDTQGFKSVTLSFTVSVLAGRTTTISGIFISPTIHLTPTQVEKGDEINISGQSFPKSQMKIFISSPKEIVRETTATAKGKWIYELDTDLLEEREHTARAKALYGDGEQSPFSQTFSFLVLPRGALVCKGADLNFDGRVNIIDFSILLYFWKQTRPANSCADINFDGIVNIVDFSIMMYQWAP